MVFYIICFQPNDAGLALQEKLKELGGEDVVIPLSVTKNEDRYLDPVTLYEGLYDVTVNRYNVGKEQWEAFKSYTVPIVNSAGNFLQSIYF